MEDVQNLELRLKLARAEQHYVARKASAPSGEALRDAKAAIRAVRIEVRTALAGGN